MLHMMSFLTEDKQQFFCSTQKSSLDGELKGRWWRRKYQESISPPIQKLHWQNLPDVTLLELWRCMSQLSPP